MVRRATNSLILPMALAGFKPLGHTSTQFMMVWQLLRQLRSFGKAPTAKQASVRFFLDRVVPEARGLHAGATAGAAGLYALSAEELAG